MEFHRPEAYTYGLLAKKPISDYKFRIRDMERMRLERHQMGTEDHFKSIKRHTQHIQMIDMADKKCVYNLIKKMVDDEMKANEHLFIEDCPKQDLIEDEKEPELSKISTEELQEIIDESKTKKDEIERKIVEEKRLQHFIVNSDELRVAAIAKRKKEIAEFNYKIIQEKEMIAKEQKVKKRELANLENTESLKFQIHQKEQEKRKILEQKEQFRNELHKQLQEKEIIREQEKELKNIERNDLIMLKKQLVEEEELEKLERIKNRKRNKEEIEQFIEERMKLFSKPNETISTLNDTFATTNPDNFTKNTTDDCEAKIQLRRENEMFMKHDAMIKEERRKQNNEMSNILMKQMKEIDDLKLSIERKNYESRRKRVEEGNKILMEQLKIREALIEQQKQINRMTYEESMIDREKYLNEMKELSEKRKQNKWQIRKYLNDQINTRKKIMEKQKITEMENHRKHMMELAEQEELLQKLLKQV
uniref:Uncharacterized protein n=1 Tax=Sipha flava TaxID=143950 RepID=A0A2S2QYS1_9HEMI